MNYLLLAILWITWCIIHSGMISLTVTGYFKNRLGDSFRFYRLIYNLIATATFILLYVYSGLQDGKLLFHWQGNMIALQLFFVAIGVLLFIAGAKTYDFLQLVGIRQISSGSSCSAASKICDIKTSGIHGLTRHPWYLGGIILVWSGFREIYSSTLIVIIILTVYLVVGTVLEERKLVVEYGDAYRDYQKKVSMLIPFKWLFSRFTK